MSTTKRLRAFPFITLLLCSYLTLLITNPPTIHAQALPPNRLIMDPTPGVPAVLLAGESFSAKVNAPNTATDWSSSIYGMKVAAQKLNILNYTLTISSKSYSSDGWSLAISVPKNAEAAAYSLSVSFLVGASRLVYRQERSVWILKEWPTTLNFGQLTDVHYPQSPEKTISGILYSELLGADFIAITGDVTDGAGVDQAIGVRELILSAATVPTIIIPGNHDRGTTAYDDYIGRRSFSLSLGRFAIIGADTGTDGILDEGELSQLQKQLDQARGRIILLLIHHPLFYGEGDLQGSADTIPVAQFYQSWTLRPDLGRRLLSLVEDYNVTAVIDGHIHTDRLLRFKSTKTNDLHWFITTTTTAGPAFSNEYNGFRFIQVKSNGAVSIPYMPSWGSLTVHPNSIPVSGSWTAGYLYARWVQGAQSAALTLNLTNVLPGTNLDGLLIPNIRATQAPQAFKEFSGGGATGGALKLLDIKQMEDRTYFLLHATLPVNSWAKVTVATFEDTTPPTGKISYTLPTKPSANEPFALYVEAQSEGWGLYNVYATYVADGRTNVVYATPFGNVFRIDLPGFPANTKTDFTVTFVDAGGLKSTAHYVLDLTQGVTTTTAAASSQTTGGVQAPTENILVIAAIVVILTLAGLTFLRLKKGRPSGGKQTTSHLI